jgi:deazaflavin-dependent oxidoreductase (nitroreductase family)
MIRDDAVTQALSHGQVIDITTTGRNSGSARRIEIVFHNIDGRVYISGIPSPNRRKWLSNLDANPNFTFHLKRGIEADLPATARVIEDKAERREILPHIARVWKRNDLEEMVRHSPLVEVVFEPGTN